MEAHLLSDSDRIVHRGRQVGQLIINQHFGNL
jgi:hypothetical protein